jgi:hypothetical protein
MFEIRVPHITLCPEIKIQLISRTFLQVGADQGIWEVTFKRASDWLSHISLRSLLTEILWILPSPVCDPTTAKDLQTNSLKAFLQSIFCLQATKPQDPLSALLLLHIMLVHMCHNEKHFIAGNWNTKAHLRRPWEGRRITSTVVSRGRRFLLLVQSSFENNSRTSNRLQKLLPAMMRRQNSGRRRHYSCCFCPLPSGTILLPFCRRKRTAPCTMHLQLLYWCKP